MAATPQTCPRCRRDTPAGANYCPTCGARVAGPPRQLRRSTSNRQLAGVCAGLAEYFDVDATLMRVLYVVGSFFTGVLPGVVLYVILAFIVPTD